jgi:dihydroorotate dehydrogenase (NAD+) catalytic subunit
MVDLTVRIGSLALANPVMPASGTFAETMASVIDLDRLGALVTKTITPDIRHGNPQPRVTEVTGAMLSSIGIPSKGPDHYLAEVLPFYARYRPPLVASISAGTADGFAALAARLSVPGVAAIEANISCPNLEADGRAFAMTAADTEGVVRRIKAATALPVWAKLTPNVGDITVIAKAAEVGGADALVVANALLAMVIDAETFRPRLGNVMGGLTGAAVKPVILRMVYQCARAVALPVIGCGGIGTVEDAVEYMLAGATAVQVGTANFIHPTAMIDIIEALPGFLERHGLAAAARLTGAVRADEAADPLWAAVG